MSINTFTLLRYTYGEAVQGTYTANITSRNWRETLGTVTFRGQASLFLETNIIPSFYEIFICLFRVPAALLSRSNPPPELIAN